MTSLPFHKYHGAGNDFVLVDDRKNKIHEEFDQADIAHICHRHFGVGADGMMFLRSHHDYDFEMVYYNSDGAPSSMCGNGGRCIVRFAADLGMIDRSCSFLAVDGPHSATLMENGWVSLGMTAVSELRELDDTFVLDTGSPHYITLAYDPSAVDVVAVGRAIRSSPPFAKEGINVNFVRKAGPGDLDIATYERGVEDETLACGTGITAAAIVAARLDGVSDGQHFAYGINAKGGRLSVRGIFRDGKYDDLWLEGPAVRVFTGTITPAVL